MSRRRDPAPGDDALAAFVRRHDPDRFLTVPFAPAPARPALLALFAFNHELARAAEVTTEPMLAAIRLQWWREVVEGAPRRHEVAEPLSEAIRDGALRRTDLLAMIEARETEPAPFLTRADWLAWLRQGAGSVAVAASRALLRAGGAVEAGAEAARDFGAAYGGAGVLRTVGWAARRGRCLLPEESLAEQGIDAAAVIARPDTPSVAATRRGLAADLSRMLRAAPPVPRGAVAACLPAVLARRDLRRADRDADAGGRGLLDRLAVMRAGLTGQV